MESRPARSPAGTERPGGRLDPKWRLAAKAKLSTMPYQLPDVQTIVIGPPGQRAGITRRQENTAWEQRSGACLRPPPPPPPKPCLGASMDTPRTTVFAFVANRNGIFPRLTMNAVSVFRTISELVHIWKPIIDQLANTNGRVLLAPVNMTCANFASSRNQCTTSRLSSFARPVLRK